jgi:hypothetical protein
LDGKSNVVDEYAAPKGSDRSSPVKLPLLLATYTVLILGIVTYVIVVLFGPVVYVADLVGSYVPDKEIVCVPYTEESKDCA